VGQVDYREAERLFDHFSSTLKLAGMAFAQICFRYDNQPEKSLMSKRETRVLQLLAEGHTADEIATSEGKSVSTIRQQISSARSRLGAKNMVHAVSLAQKLNLIR